MKTMGTLSLFHLEGGRGEARAEPRNTEMTRMRDPSMSEGGTHIY